MNIELSPTGWGRVLLCTIGGAAFCVAATLVVDAIHFAGLSGNDLRQAVLIDILLPSALSIPLLLYFSLKLRELAIAHQQLAIFALTDALTNVLNRAAFWTLAEAYLGDTRVPEAQRFGALLIIDADNFKQINDRFGHDRGDDALVVIAGAIRHSLRSSDIVARLGGEEFGVFLPGTALRDTRGIAERIRNAVAAARFSPAGRPYELSVSIGGAVFADTLPFADLFREADQQLYVAKRAGRNRVVIATTGSGSGAALATA